jgi:hypothetical protein
MATCAPTPFLGITANTTAASPFSLQISDSTRRYTACIEETFLFVKKGIDFNSQYVFTRNSSGESRSNRPSSLSPHFLVLELAVANASSAPLVSPPFSSYFSIGAVEPLFARPLPSSLPFPSRLPAPILCLVCLAWDCYGNKWTGLSWRVSAMIGSVKALRGARKE